MAVQRFQDLVAWQKARVLAVDVYRVSRDGEFGRDFGLRGQIQRAAVSTMANIAEGFARNRSAEFQRYLEIARGSLAETWSHLYIASDVGYVHPEDFDRLSQACDELGRILGGLARSAESATRHAVRTKD